MITYESIPFGAGEVYLCTSMEDTIERHTSAEDLIEQINESRERMKEECLFALHSMNITPTDDARLFGFVDIVGEVSFGDKFYCGHNYNDAGISSGIRIRARTLTAGGY